LNQGFSLNGTDAIVVLNSTGLYPNSGSLTITAWVKSSASGSSQFITSLYECAGYCPGGQANGLVDLSIDATGKFVAGTRGSANVSITLTSAMTVNDGKFHHVALIRDTTALLLRIFVDGIAEGSMAIPAETINNSDGEMDPIQIGARRNASASSSTGHFHGTIDDVQWFLANLTATDILALSCEGRVCFGMADGIACDDKDPNTSVDVCQSNTCVGSP